MNDHVALRESKDESDQRLIHRLEAFSDIVIGFSLAQLALSLVIPRNGALGFGENPGPLIAFVITFTLVCGMWWAHHKLFAHYFVPIAPMVVLNFVTLAGVSFAVYSVQLMFHVGTPAIPASPGHPFQPAIPGHSALDFAFYEGSLAFVYTLLGIQYFYGWTVRRTQMPPNIADRGLRAGLMLGGIGIIFVVMAIVTVRSGLRVSGIQYIGFIILAYAVFLRLLFRYVEARRARGVSPREQPQGRS
ncbi:MAG TPA: TMEM175 family protein [Candidatus Rubrimentiphilum sp.]|nr:TMEM175 family protein [Candidatus Rubrimentiphilum sp.]